MSDKPEIRDAEAEVIDVAVPAPLPRCGFNPNASCGIGASIIDGASLGDLASLQALARVSMQEALSCAEGDPYALVCAAEALTLSRICAARRVPRDVRALAGMLCLTSDLTRQIGFIDAADELMGESVAILERLAGEGDDIADVASCRLAETNPAVIDIAKGVLLKTQEIA